MEAENEAVTVEFECGGVMASRATLKLDGDDISRFTRAVNIRASVDEVTEVTAVVLATEGFKGKFPAKVQVHVLNAIAMLELRVEALLAFKKIRAHAQDTGLSNSELEWLDEIVKAFEVRTSRIIDDAMDLVREEPDVDLTPVEGYVAGSDPIQRAIETGPSEDVPGANGLDKGDGPSSDQRD